jgi:hypothetical protein
MLPRFYRITYALGGLDEALAPKQFATLLEALVWTHALYIQNHPGTPKVDDLLRSGALRFDPNPMGFRPEGSEDWNDIPSTLGRPGPDGVMTANDRTIAAWKAAELRVLQDVPAKAALVHEKGERGRTMARAVVTVPGQAAIEPVGNQGWRPLTGKVHRSRARVTFVLDLFGEGDLAISHATLQCMLDALTDIDARYLITHPDTPKIYASGVRYEEEPPGQEDWQDVATTLRMGVGDCDDVAPWLAAEKRVAGIDARPTFKDQQLPGGATLYHILTLNPDGTIEDPSRVLGMR